MSQATPSAITHDPRRAGRIWLACMGLFLALAGLLFTAVLWRSYQRAMETRAWIETPCRIVSSMVLSEHPTPHSPMAFRLGLQYEYEFKRERHIGTKVKRVEGESPHKDAVEALADEYPGGKTTSCYVNPAQPAEAILQHATKAALYTIWFPLLFVFGGGMMAWRAMAG